MSPEQERRNTEPRASHDGNNPAPAGATLPALETLVRLLDSELATSVIQRSGDTADGPGDVSARLIRFAVGDAVFAVAVDQLAEVDAVPPTTFLPRVPAAVRGLANLRGKVIVVIDLGRFLGLPARAEVSRNVAERMIVLRDAGHAGRAGRAGHAGRGGVIVDRVFGIASYELERLRPPTTTLPEPVLPFVAGSAVLDGVEVAVIDLEAIVAAVTSWSEAAAP